MESHCLKHQGRVATKRCVSCLKPLCDECTQAYTDGIYCGDTCHEAAKATEARAAQIAQSDAELKEWQQKQMAIKMVVSLVVVCVLFFGWEHFPSAVTDPVEKIWASIKGLVGSLSPKK